MKRFDPSTIPLQSDWRKMTLAQLRNSLGIEAGSATDKALKNILAHEMSEVAVKYLLAATMPSAADKRFFLSFAGNKPGALPTQAWLLQFWHVMHQAVSGCLSARFAADLPPETRFGGGQNFQQGADLVRRAAEYFTLSDFTEKFATGRRGKKTSLKKMNNEDIVDALAIAQEWAWRLSPDKEKRPTGRPSNHAHRSLMKLLRDLFKKILGTPVNHAVAALVTATFPEMEPLTEKDVRERSSR